MVRSLRARLVLGAVLVGSSGCLTTAMWNSAMLSPVEGYGVAIDRPVEGWNSLILRAKGLRDLEDGFHYVAVPASAPVEAGAALALELYAPFGSEHVPKVDRPLARLEAEDLARAPPKRADYGILVPTEWSCTEQNEVELYAASADHSRWVWIGRAALGPTAGEWSSRGAIRARYLCLSVGTVILDTAAFSLALAVVLLGGLSSSS